MTIMVCNEFVVYISRCPSLEFLALDLYIIEQEGATALIIVLLSLVSSVMAFSSLFVLSFFSVVPVPFPSKFHCFELLCTQYNLICL